MSCQDVNGATPRCRYVHHRRAPVTPAVAGDDEEFIVELVNAFLSGGEETLQ